MTTQRDFLNASPSAVTGSTNEFLAKLMAEQNDYLSDIALYLRRQNASVLASAVVKGTSQVTNAITDLNPHEVTFQVSGKPVEIYSLLVYSTYNQTITLSPNSPSNVNDGIKFIAGDVLVLPLTLMSVWIQATALSGATCAINGPASATNGGFFLRAFTTSDFDYGSRRS